MFSLREHIKINYPKTYQLIDPVIANTAPLSAVGNVINEMLKGTEFKPITDNDSIEESLERTEKFLSTN